MRERLKAAMPTEALGVDRLDKLMRFKLDKKSRAVNDDKSPASFHRIRLFFKKYDVNDDGEIDMDEFVEMLKDLGLRNLHEDDIKGVFARIDVDGSGSIDVEEFAGYVTDSFTSEATPYRGLVEKQSSIITDMPTTVDSHETKFKSDQQLKHDIKWEFKNAMARQGAQIREHFKKIAAAQQRSAEEDAPANTSTYSEVRAVQPESLIKMLRENFAIGIGTKKALDIIVMEEAKKTQGGMVTWKAMSAAFKQSEQEKGKYYSAIGEFDGRSVGKKELKKILISKLERHAVQRGARFTTPSNRHLKKLFHGIDRNGNGSLELEEFEALLLRLGTRHISKDDAHALFRELDVDGSGSIDYQEFCTNLLGLQWKDEKGIVDLPDTVNSAKYQGKTDAQLLALAREDVSRQLQRYRVTRTQLEGYLCGGAAAAAKITRGKAEAKITRVRTKNCIRGRLHAAVGNERGVDLLFDQALGVDSVNGTVGEGGAISFDMFIDVFLLDETRAQQLIPTKHKLFTSKIDGDTGKEAALKEEMMEAYKALRKSSTNRPTAAGRTMEDGSIQDGSMKGSSIKGGSIKGSSIQDGSSSCTKGGKLVSFRPSIRGQLREGKQLSKPFVTATTAGTLSSQQIIAFVQAAVVRMAKSKNPDDPKEVVRQLARVFRQAAQNDSLGAYGLQACLKKYFSLQLSTTQVATLFGLLDTAGTGSLDRTTFLKGFLTICTRSGGRSTIKSTGVNGNAATVHFARSGSSSHGAPMMSPIRPRAPRRSGGKGTRGTPVKARVRADSRSSSSTPSQAPSENWHGGVFETISNSPRRVQLEQFLRNKGWKGAATSSVMHLVGKPPYQRPQHQVQMMPKPASFRPRGAGIAIMQALSATATSTNRGEKGTAAWG
jgi:Ca2+-binding EF-hand superfamily protein